MSPRRRKPVRLPEECIHTIAQTLSISVTPEVAKMLAPDAEYRLREIIKNAKSYMRHSKRSRLTVRDVALAHKLHLSRPLHGHGQPGPSTFTQVTNGVFVESDSVQALQDVYSMPLPKPHLPTALRTSWLSTARSLGAKSVYSDKSGDQQFKKTFQAILTKHDEPLFDAAIREISRPMSADRIEVLVLLLQDLVRGNAKSGGDTRVLCNALRVICALIVSDHVCIDMFIDTLLPIILTCLLGKRVGNGDQWDVREHAGYVLREWAQMTLDKEALLRTSKTIVYRLTNQGAPVETIFGAIHGLSALGEDIFRMHFAIHLPALLHALRQSIENAETPLIRKEVEERVFRIGQAISDAVQSFGNERVSEVTDILGQVR